MFRLDSGLILALYPRSELAKDAQIPQGPAQSGEFSIGHIVGSRADVDALLAQAEAAGATITDEPHDRPWGIYSGYFRDPDGPLGSHPQPIRYRQHRLTTRHESSTAACSRAGNLDGVKHGADLLVLDDVPPTGARLQPRRTLSPPAQQRQRLGACRHVQVDRRRLGDDRGCVQRVDGSDCWKLKTLSGS
jgi:catechol 2,3-dioxygenase-like lactoylglutathione lyase family enzyme